MRQTGLLSREPSFRLFVPGGVLAHDAPASVTSERTTQRHRERPVQRDPHYGVPHGELGRKRGARRRGWPEPRAGAVGTGARCPGHAHQVGSGAHSGHAVPVHYTARLSGNAPTAAVSTGPVRASSGAYPVSPRPSHPVDEYQWQHRLH